MSIINKIKVKRASLFSYPSQHSFKEIVDGEIKSSLLTPSNMMVEDTSISNLDKSGIRQTEVSQNVDLTRIERAERLSKYVSHQPLKIEEK